MKMEGTRVFFIQIKAESANQEQTPPRVNLFVL